MSIKQEKSRIILGFFISFLIFFFLFEPVNQIKTEAASSISVPAKVSGNNVYVRKKASRTAEKLIYKENDVKLSKNIAVTVKGQSIVKGEKWYKLSFRYNKKTLTGYMLSDYVKLTLKTPVKAKIISSSAQKIITKAGKNTYLKVNRKAITLAKGKAVKIQKEINVLGMKWFYVSFTYKSKTYKGYVMANSITFVAENVTVTTSPKPVTTTKPASTKKPATTTKPVASKKPTVTPSKSPSPSPSKTPVAEKKSGYVTASKLNVRTGAGTTYGNLTYQSKNVQLIKGTAVTILASDKVSSVTWYQVKFEYLGEKLTGYVCGSYVALGEAPEPSKAPTVKPSPSVSPSPSSSQIPLTNSEFAASLKSEGFPECYLDELTFIHERYPLWQFKAYKTGYDWNTAIGKETAVGKNLITNSKAAGWKSYESGAYNWSKDTFVPFDGSTWVTASKAAIEYYMDPRNFLTTDGIFQFEYLAYEPQYQTVAGVESILRNTVLSNASYSYKDEGGTSRNITYGETFLEAAENSQVNPFHLATRVKQEVVTSKGLSSSATGTFSGYTGYYNFYNIGATHSTAANGAIINGLTFAKSGTGLSAANKTTFLIPWNSQYNSIVGGAKYIGNNYINRGQNTVYLQKFNLSSYSTFNHQYMANVEAAKAEAQKTYAAYQDFLEIPVVFYIPVYENMPASNCPVPGTVLNPNNWLKSLSVTGCTMTPTFNIANNEDTTYTVMVDSDTTSVKINAASVSSLATVEGAGTHSLAAGTNTFKVKVTAQNGDVRTYIIYVIRT